MCLQKFCNCDERFAIFRDRIATAHDDNNTFHELVSDPAWNLISFQTLCEFIWIDETRKIGKSP
jgi:hypothetical protein